MGDTGDEEDYAPDTSPRVVVTIDGNVIIDTTTQTLGHLRQLFAVMPRLFGEENHGN